MVSMKSRYSVIKNKKFGFFQIKPTPSKEEVDKYYKKEFYSTKKYFNNASLKVQMQDKEFFDSRWKNMYSKFNLLLKKKDKISMLDVGCGWAQSLIYFKKKGYECYGFDPSKEAIEYALKNKIIARQSFIEDMNVFGNKKFDIITLINVLEHLRDPIEALVKIKKLLKSGGIILIDVPNDFNEFQIVGAKVHKLKNWWIAPPRHLNYFSNTTLCKVLKNLGYKVLLSEASFPIEIFLLFNENYVLDKNLGKKCHKKRILFEKNLIKFGKEDLLNNFYKSLAQLNLGRQISIYAQK